MDKKVLYAAVGAPVVAVKSAQERFDTMRAQFMQKTTTLSKDARKRWSKQVEAAAVEGEKLVNRIAEGKVVDEITDRIDFEQVQNQVSRLRDQLETMLETWRSNFRPAGKPVSKPANKPAAIKPEPVMVESAQSKPAAKKTQAKKSGAKKANANKTATAKKSETVAKPATQES